MSLRTSENAQEWFSGRLGAGKDWQEIVAWVGDLPPLPDIASQAIVLVENPDTTSQQLTTLLGKDPALAARVLKIANSAMFARQREITTLTQAITLIGFKALKGIIIAATVRQLSRDVNPLEQMVWENSACTAAAAHAIARRYKKSLADEAFMYGLLHDLGKLVLLRQIPDDYDKVCKIASEGHPFVEVEQDLLGYAHPLIGALVAKKWNFSLQTCAAILHHHDPMPATLDTIEEQLTAIIQAADGISHMLGFGHPAGYPDLTGPSLELLQRQLNIPADQHAALLDEVRNTYAEQRAALG